MAVLRPLKLVITNWPTDDNGEPVVEYREAVNNPENEADGVRPVPFSGELVIEADDFMLDPPKHFFRRAPGRGGVRAYCGPSSSRSSSGDIFCGVPVCHADSHSRIAAGSGSPTCGRRSATSLTSNRSSGWASNSGPPPGGASGRGRGGEVRWRAHVGRSASRVRHGTRERRWCSGRRGSPRCAGGDPARRTARRR